MTDSLQTTGAESPDKYQSGGNSEQARSQTYYARKGEAMTDTFIPSLTVTAADDAHAVWLAMMDYKYKLWSRAEKYMTDGQDDLARSVMRESERVNRLQTSAYDQYVALSDTVTE